MAKVPELSVVIPVYYNAGSLDSLYHRIAKTLARARCRNWEILFVDDRSGDTSRDVLARLRAASPRVGVIHLLRNSGSPRAILAGLQACRGRAVLVMAADLQDPPEMAGVLLERWRSGDPVVLAQRESRKDALSTVILAQSFYWLFRRLVTRAMPKGGFDLFLADRRVIDDLIRYSDKNSNIFATLVWLGYSYHAVRYHRQEREHGRSRWTFAKKITYFYDSLLNFTYLPLRLLTLMGLLSILFSAAYGSVILYFALRRGMPVQGWASTMIILLFFSGANLMGLGLVGEYLWRTFDVVRRQPAFVVDRTYPPRQDGPRPEDGR